MSQAKHAAGSRKNSSLGSKTAFSPAVEPGKIDPPPSQNDESQGDLITDLWLRFGRFGWDALGMALMALALVSFIGLLGQSIGKPWAQGVLISLWVNLVARAFGWGWPLVVLAIGILVLLCLRRFSGLPKIPLARVLALEGFAFCLLTFLSINNSFSLDRAEAGKDGGFIGWGLATLLDRIIPVPWGAVFVIGLGLLFAGYGTGFFQWLFNLMESWLNEVSPAETSPGISAPVSMAAESFQPVANPFEKPIRSPKLPPFDLLLTEQNVVPEESYIEETARRIEHTLAEFGIPAIVKGYRVGPTVTQYALEPGFIEKTNLEGETIRQKVRVSQVSALSRDLALSLSAERLRIEAPVPGRDYIGVEVPNQLVSVVRLRPLLECEAFTRLASPLAIALGKDVSGQPVVADLARMPHLLIAGTTGSGKSVLIAALAVCLVMNNLPEDMRMAMLDPKMVELVRFNGLPHLFGQVETEIDRMLGVLRWAIMEMDRRYRLLEEARARDIVMYNQRMVKRGQPKLPRIVIFIDELADLMMTAPSDVESYICRLAQMARAVGIHLVVATQRPSVDVITGLIKANFPSRISFAVSSQADSKTILDGPGAEKLLGNGDMLFSPVWVNKSIRGQGAYISTAETKKIVEHWLNQNGEIYYSMDFVLKEEAAETSDDDEDLYREAVTIVIENGKASTSLLQRRLRIGFNRAARLIERMESEGLVGPYEGSKPRKVIANRGDDI